MFLKTCFSLFLIFPIFLKILSIKVDKKRNEFARKEGKKKEFPERIATEKRKDKNRAGPRDF